MLLLVFSVLVFIPWNMVPGRQIPVVEGTLGGVPASAVNAEEGPVFTNECDYSWKTARR